MAIILACVKRHLHRDIGYAWQAITMPILVSNLSLGFLGCNLSHLLYLNVCMESKKIVDIVSITELPNQFF